MFVANPLEIPDDVFMYTLHPKRLEMLTEGPTDAEKALAGAHWAYSQELLAKKVIIFGGRTVDRTQESFAICVIRAGSEEQARAIMCAARRAVEEANRARGGGGAGALSLKKSLEWFLERRRNKATAAAGIQRHLEDSSNQ